MASGESLLGLEALQPGIVKSITSGDHCDSPMTAPRMEPRTKQTAAISPVHSLSFHVRTCACQCARANTGPRKPLFMPHFGNIELRAILHRSCSSANSESWEQQQITESLGTRNSAIKSTQSKYHTGGQGSSTRVGLAALRLGLWPGPVRNPLSRSSARPKKCRGRFGIQVSSTQADLAPTVCGITVSSSIDGKLASP